MATTEHSDLEQQIIKTAQQLFIEDSHVFNAENTGYSKTGYPIYGATKHDSG